MNFGDCIRSAQRQGMMDEDEADALISRYEQHREARAGAGEADPDGAAKAALGAELEQAAARKALLAQKAQEAQGRVRTYLEGFRDLNGKANVFEAAVNLIENFGAGAGTSSIAGRSKAIIALAHGEMADLLSTFRRSRLTGARFNKPMFDDVIREVLGEGTGKAEAAGMGQAVTRVFERLRQEFNEAGGDIGKLDRYMPQFHDPHALLKAGYDKWREGIIPRLDMDRMKDPLTGGALTPQRLDDGLRVAYDRITTGGWSDREPSAVAFGKGSLANQRQEHRFLHFKTADDWLAYDRDFGHGDPVKAVFNHVNSMARDIAAMEVLGPNPNATINWIKQVVQSEIGKANSGQPSLYAGSIGTNVGDKINYQPWRIQAIYDYVRGRQVVSGKIATGFGNVRNFLTSVQLGGASILAATTDPFLDATARYMAGLPITKALGGIAYAIKSGSTREQAVRSGMILDDFMHIVGDEARYAGTLGGSEWSKWLADRTVNLNGLEPLTQARRHVFGLDFQATIADAAGQAWDDVAKANPYLRRAMESYGFTAKDWNALRKTELFRPDDSAGWLQPADVKNRDVAKRYLEMIMGETERAVPTGTARSRSFITGSAPQGTVFGEILESGLQYKSFTLSFTTLQLQAIKQELNQGPARAAGYAASLFTVLTLGGALAVQIKSIVNGKDLQPMDPSTGQGFKFWLHALASGGGAGVLGDFMFADQTRFGANLPATLLGPTVGLADDVFLKLGWGNVQEAMMGKKTRIGREAVRTAGKYVPVVSTLPYTRAAYQRTVIDQLQYLTDPEAHKYFREQEMRTRRETGQGYWWRPGASSPDRGPEWPSAVK